MAKIFKVNTISLSGTPISINPSDSNGLFRHDGVWDTTVVRTTQTGDFYPRTNPSGFVLSTQTGSFVTTGQTGVFSNADTLDGQHGSYYINTGQTGVFVASSNTGSFLTTGAGDIRYALVTNTGSFVTTGDSRNLKFGGFVGIRTTGVLDVPLEIVGYHSPFVALKLSYATQTIPGTFNQPMFLGQVPNSCVYVGDIFRNTEIDNSWTPKNTFGNLIKFQEGAMGLYADAALTPNVGYKPTERLTILSDGNIGIGKTPLYKLDVDGNILASGIFVSGNPVLTGSLASFATSMNLASTGAFLQSEIVAISGATGNFLTTGQTGQFAARNQAVYITGDQTINGVKTFGSLKLNDTPTSALMLGMGLFSIYPDGSFAALGGGVSCEGDGLIYASGMYVQNNPVLTGVATGSFLTTGAGDGRYALSSSTGSFITATQTGGFVTTGDGRVLNFGGLGIGTYPTSALDVSGIIVGAAARFGALSLNTGSTPIILGASLFTVDTDGAFHSAADFSSDGGDISSDGNGTLTAAGFLVGSDPVVLASQTGSFVTTGDGRTLGFVGSVGIGTVPTTKLDVANTSTDAVRGITSSQHNSDTHGAQINLKKSRNVLSTPQTVVTGDVLGRIVGFGHDGSNYLEMAAIEIVSTGTIGTGRVPTKMTFSVATNAATSVLTERMVILADGTVGIGKTPTRKLDVDGIISATNNSFTTGDGAFIANGANPSIMQNVQRPGGAYAYALFQGRAYNTTTTLSSLSVEYGVYGDLQSGVTPPSVYYAYFGVGASAAYDNPVMVLQPNGNVGIGPTVPLEKLHVGSGTGINIQFGTYGALGTTYGGAATVLGMNVAGNTVSADGMHYMTDIAIGGQAIRMKATDGMTFHTIATGSESVGGAFTSERMRITPAGDVGIGTTAPVSVLEIQGGLTTVGSVLTLGTKETSVEANDVLGRINFYAPLEASGTDAVTVSASIVAMATAEFTSSVNNTSLLFQTGSSGVATTKMTLDAGGGLTITGAFGCNGAAAQGAYGVNNNSTDLDSVIALCNQLRAALVANGICAVV